MKALLTKSKLIWLTITISLLLTTVSIFFILIDVYLSNNYWKNQFKNVTVYKNIQIIPQKITLNQSMKKWINDNKNSPIKYYRVVIKGYGSYGQILKGNGSVRSSIKHFYLTEKEIDIQNDVLKTSNDGIFCGSWQLIPITVEQFAYNRFK